MNRLERLESQIEKLQAELKRCRRRYVSVSTQNLKKVLEWVEYNENNPLADAYLAACYSCSFWDHQNVSEAIDYLFDLHGPKNYSSPQWGKIRGRTSNIEQLAYIHRDSVAREILLVIKSELKGKDRAK